MELNQGDFVGAYNRTMSLVTRGINKDKIAKFLNAEFHMTNYVSNGKLWTQFKDERGVPQVRVLA